MIIDVRRPEDAGCRRPTGYVQLSLSNVAIFCQPPPSCLERPQSQKTRTVGAGENEHPRKPNSWAAFPPQIIRPPIVKAKQRPFPRTSKDQQALPYLRTDASTFGSPIRAEDLLACCYPPIFAFSCLLNLTGPSCCLSSLPLTFD